MKKVHSKICYYVTGGVLRLLAVFTGQTLYSPPGSCGMTLTVLHLIVLVHDASSSFCPFELVST